MIGKEKEHRTWNVLVAVFVVLVAAFVLFRSFDSDASARIFNSDRGSSPEAVTPSVYFEENRGQLDPRVRYHARGTDGYALFLTDRDAAFVVISEETRPAARPPENSGTPEKPNLVGWSVFLRFEGANEGTTGRGATELSHRSNFFAGDDPDKWVTSVPNYARVSTENIYGGVDLEWSAIEQGLAGITLSAKKESDLQAVSIVLEGADGVSLAKDGGIELLTPSGTISIPPPRVIIDGKESALGPGAAFEVLSGPEDDLDAISSYRLGISIQDKRSGGDPEPPRSSRAGTDTSSAGSLSNLAYSTFIGGNMAEGRAQQDLHVDSLGRAFIMGSSISTTYPTTPGSYDPVGDPLHSIVVTKFNAAGSALIYSTYIQATAGVVGHAMAVDSSGSAYLTGFVGYADIPGATHFPITPGAYDETHNGDSDIFVTKLDPSGSFLEFSTYIGGSSDEYGHAIDVDSSGNTYLTGYTPVNTDFPVTPGSFGSSPHPEADCYVLRLNAAGDDLDYSGIFGGDGLCHAWGIAVDTTGAAYVTGITDLNSTLPFPTTTGAFDETENGNSEAFVTKINPAGTAIEYSTVLGGGQDDRGWDIEVDNLGRAYVVGEAEWSTTQFPSTAGTYQEEPLSRDAFIVRLSPNGSTMQLGTFYGSDITSMVATDIALAADGSVYIAGRTDGPGLPTTPNAYDATFNGEFDAVVAEFSSDFTTLEYATYIGGNDWDWGYSVDIDPDENLYMFGYTEDGTIPYPTTPGAFDTTINSNGNGQGDWMLTKFGKGVITTVYVPFDFDGDGISDIAVFRPVGGPLSGTPETGPGAQWWILHSGDLSTRGAAFGISSDIPVPADFTGDGIEDIVFFRPGIGDWYVLRSEDSTFFAFPFGVSGDIPAPGDFDGDGTADPTVYRPQHGVWFSFLSGSSQTVAIPFGVTGDRPLIGDYDGDGKDDIAIYRPSANQWWQFRSSEGVKAYAFGAPGDIPTVPVDFTGDGTDDVIYFRPSDGNWFVLRSDDDTYFAFPWGVTGDLPVPGYFDDDNIADAAIFRPSNATWYIFGSNSGFRAVQFGISSDVPLPYAYAAP